MTLLNTVYDTISGGARSLRDWWVCPSESERTKPEGNDLKAGPSEEILISQEGAQSYETVHELHPDSRMSCPDADGYSVFRRLVPNRWPEDGEPFWVWPGPAETTKIAHGCLYQGGLETQLAGTHLESRLKDWESDGYTIINKTERDGGGLRTSFSIIEATDTEWKESDLIKVGSYRHFIL